MYRIAVEPIGPCAGGGRLEASRRAALAALRRLEPRITAVGHAADGSPVPLGADGRPLPGMGITISHSRRLAAVAVTPADVRAGIDIEQPRAQLLLVAPKYLTADELRLTGPRLPMLAAAWSAKEAVYKAAGTPGLALTDIALRADGRHATLPDGRRWRLVTAWLCGHALTLTLPARRDDASDGPHIDDTNIDGTHIVGTNIDGTNIVGTHIVGTNIDGTNIDGTHIVGTLFKASGPDVDIGQM